MFVDVGANTGIYTLKAAKHYSAGGDGVVVALEPFPDVLATLHHNVQANGFTNVRLRNFCASDQTRPAKLWMNFNKPNSSSLFQRDQNALCLSTLIVSLDDLFSWEGLNRLDYLKIDAEGAETEVLTGGEDHKQISANHFGGGEYQGGFVNAQGLFRLPGPGQCQSNLSAQ